MRQLILGILLFSVSLSQAWRGEDLKYVDHLPEAMRVPTLQFRDAYAQICWKAIPDTYRISSFPNWQAALTYINDNDANRSLGIAYPLLKPGYKTVSPLLLFIDRLLIDGQLGLIMPSDQAFKSSFDNIVDNSLKLEDGLDPITTSPPPGSVDTKVCERMKSMQTDPTLASNPIFQYISGLMTYRGYNKPMDKEMGIAALIRAAQGHYLSALTFIETHRGTLNQAANNLIPEVSILKGHIKQIEDPLKYLSGFIRRSQGTPKLQGILPPLGSSWELNSMSSLERLLEYGPGNARRRTDMYRDMRYHTHLGLLKHIEQAEQQAKAAERPSSSRDLGANLLGAVIFGSTAYTYTSTPLQNDSLMPNATASVYLGIAANGMGTLYTGWNALKHGWKLCGCAQRCKRGRVSDDATPDFPELKARLFDESALISLYLVLKYATIIDAEGSFSADITSRSWSSLVLGHLKTKPLSSDISFTKLAVAHYAHRSVP